VGVPCIAGTEPILTRNAADARQCCVEKIRRGLQVARAGERIVGNRRSLLRRLGLEEAQAQLAVFRDRRNDRVRPWRGAIGGLPRIGDGCAGVARQELCGQHAQVEGAIAIREEPAAHCGRAIFVPGQTPGWLLAYGGG
jgi:hypothetical protein